MASGKEISFSEFLREDALKPEVVEDLESVDSVAERQPPRLPQTEPVAELELKEFWKALRHFFQTGAIHFDLDRPDLLPALIAQNVRNGAWNTEYPYFLPSDSRKEAQSLDSLLRSVFEDTFDEDQAPILKLQLSRLERELFDKVREQGGLADYQNMIDDAIEVLQTVDVHGPEGEQYDHHIKRYGEALSGSGQLIGFSADTPLHILNYLLRREFDLIRKPYLRRIEQLKSGLRDLLEVESDKQGSKGQGENFDFADSIIAFDQLERIMPQNASEQMGTRRLNRIKEIYQTLGKGLDLLSGNQGIVLISDQMMEHYPWDWSGMLRHCKIVSTHPGEGCIDAKRIFREQIDEYTHLISAVRMAELEIKDQYQTEVHDVFFDHFTWHQFTPEELIVCPSIILIELADELLKNELNEYSHLLASNKPIRVVALKQEPFGQRSKNGQLDEGEYAFRQELGALTLAHRNAFTLQSTADLPSHLIDGMNNGLSSPTPSLFHVLIPGPGDVQGADEFIHNSAAVESRMFPRFIYDHEKGMQWGSRFDISENPQPDHRWPVYPLEVRGEHGDEEEVDIAFTYADYFALYPEHLNALSPVPPEYWTEDLLPLNEYLDRSSEELYGKIPFIWTIDKSNVLTKIAIPYSLVQEAQERLDFWNFIQELGGVNSYHVKRAIEQTTKELKEESKQAIEQLEEEHRRELEENERQAASEAMDKLSAFLLDLGDLDHIVRAPTPKTGEDSSVSKEIEETSEEKKKAEPENGEDAFSSIPNEPWIESFLCTSCNECTDNYPAVFKYNEDKQAYIADASAATYKELVWAAEECPAQCIHPGLPDDPDDPEMEEWMQRAKPFNE